MKDRPYQEQLNLAIKQAIRDGHRSILVYAPTGAGKTNIGGRIMVTAEAKGNPSVFLAPRRELVYQTHKRLARFGCTAGMIMAGEPMARARLCQVASYDTLHSRAIKRKRIELPPAKIVIPDEAHLSLAETRENIIRSWPDAITVGLTATPARGDGKPLKGLYSTLVKGPTEGDLIRDGYLVGVRYYGPSKPDLSAVKQRRNDYVDSSSEKVMNTPQLIGDIVDNWKRLAEGQSTVVFCCTKAHAKAVTEAFVNAGITAELVVADTKPDDRKQIFARVESGETTVLVNVFVASYGLDIPRLAVCVLARPTKSMVIYRQMGGRVLRPVYADWADAELLEESAELRLAAIQDSLKPYAILIDHVGAVDKLGYLEDAVPWTLEGEENVADVAQREREAREAPKPLTCPACKHIFSGSKFCPACGFELIAPGKPIPTHKADLVEKSREDKPTDGKEANRKTSWEDKAAFMGQAKAYAASKGFKSGYAASLYREKFGVWPNDPRVHDAPPQPAGELVLGFIKHKAIKKRFTPKAPA